MKYLVVLVWTVSLAAGSPFKSILQARQLNHHHHHHVSRAFPLRSRQSTIEPYILQRRADQASSSRETRPRYPSSGQRSATASVTAKGPAHINTTGMRGAETKDVPSRTTGHLQNHHPSYAIAGGRSTATIPYNKEMVASAKGQTVVGQVIPPRGAKGNIRFRVGGQITEIPVNDREGKFHTSGDFASGVAKVSASTKHGGQVNVFAINHPDSRDQQ